MCGFNKESLLLLLDFVIERESGKDGNMKKRGIMIALALCVTLAFAGCSGGKGKEDKESKNTGEKIDISDVKDSDDAVKALELKDLDKYMTLGQYKGLEGTKMVYEITEEDVNAQINGTLSEKAAVVTDRPVQDGDIVNIDYVGTVDGVEFEGGKGQNYDLTIGSGEFIDGFETGLIGATTGQEVDVNVTFPDPYQNNTDLSGKAAVFHVTVNSISAAPELTDEWVAANTEYKTADEYKESIKKMIEDSNDDQSVYYLATSLFSQVQENSDIKEYPKDLLEKETQNYKDQIESLYATAAGMSMEDFIEAQGYTEDTFNELAEEKGKERLQQKMIVQAIMNAEKMKISKEDYDKMVEDYAAKYGFESKEVMLENYGEDMVKDTILWNQVGNVLIENGKITDQTVDEGEADTGAADTGSDSGEDTTE